MPAGPFDSGLIITPKHVVGQALTSLLRVIAVETVYPFARGTLSPGLLVSVVMLVLEPFREVSMKKSSAIRVGLAGLGRFGSLHARILSSSGAAELIAVCDPDPVRREWAIETLGVPKAVESFEELARTPDLDCLFIVTPEDLHASHALRALDLGIPIFMEKPLATNTADAHAIVAKATASGIPLQIGFVLRFDAQHAMLAARIQSGEFGPIVSIRAKRNCSQSWFAIYGDRAHTVYETIIHDIDLILWYTGSRCRTVYAAQRHLTGHTYPDALLAILQFENGAMATLESSWLVPDSAPRNVDAGDWSGTIDAELEVIGTKQSTRYRMLDSGMVVTSGQHSIHPETGLWPEVHGAIGGALRLEVEHFLACVRTARASNVASLPDTLHGLEIAEAIVRSAETGAEITIENPGLLGEHLAY
jgi:predicted dehydrogenase